MSLSISRIVKYKVILFLLAATQCSNRKRKTDDEKAAMKPVKRANFNLKDECEFSNKSYKLKLNCILTVAMYLQAEFCPSWAK